MTGQHRKPSPEPPTFLVRPVDAERVREAIAGVAADAINRAAETVRKLREWCESTEADARKVAESCGCSEDNEPCPLCRSVCERQLALVEEVRALLPPIPEAAGEVSDGHA